MNPTTTLLIVDDEPAGRETLTALLHDQGYQLIFADSGAAALNQAAASRPDLVLLDVMMPDMDGYAVCSQMRADPSLAEVPILLITALNDRGALLTGLSAGADDFISKPFDRIALRARIRAITRLNRYRRLLIERTRFERVVELAPNGLLIVDAEGVIQLANPAMCHLIGISAAALVHASAHALVTDEAAARFAQELQAVLDDPAYVARFESALLSADKLPMPVVIDACAIDWADAPAVHLSVRDIREQKQAEAQRGIQMERLSALREIDHAIAANLDLHVTLNFVLAHALRHLSVDAAAVLLRRPQSQTFEYALIRGYPRSALRQHALRLGEGYAGQVALARHTLDLYALHDVGEIPLREAPAFYYGVPLIVKGQVEGVLELFGGAPVAVDAAWLEFLETLAGQITVAIDHAALFASMQRANDELALAYTHTLEGWARALELRDKETEGHAQRVTARTLALARALGVDDRALVHIQRGALLNDIGKMGVPDSILLKPGPLTEDEWAVMRQHPVYAYEMLAPIAYLQPALEIPYCHHERWDGSGYPRGLRGEAIPLAARIFAVVDVWDALRFDRPYRAGWPEERVRAHLRAEAGAHFDPQVVEAFLQLDVINASKLRPAVLIVDDDESIRQLARRSLEEAFTLYTAASAEEALEILAQQQIAVVVADQRMPAMTGVQLLERAKHISPDTLGILSSGYLDSAALTEALNLGNVRGYIPKPWNLDDLYQRIVAVAQHYQYMKRLQTKQAALPEAAGEPNDP